MSSTIGEDVWHRRQWELKALLAAPLNISASAGRTARDGRPSCLPVLSCETGDQLFGSPSKCGFLRRRHQPRTPEARVRSPRTRTWRSCFFSTVSRRWIIVRTALGAAWTWTVLLASQHPFRACVLRRALRRKRVAAPGHEVLPCGFDQCRQVTLENSSPSRVQVFSTAG
jgi:hypothetical protein